MEWENNPCNVIAEDQSTFFLFFCVFSQCFNKITINSDYSKMYFLCLVRSAENLSSNLFLISISVLVKPAKHFIHDSTVFYVNQQRRGIIIPI